MTTIPPFRSFSSDLTVNPGAVWHPGDRHSPEQAALNIEHLAADLAAKGAVVADVEPIIDFTEIEAAQSMSGTKYQDDHDGRYPFRMIVDGKRHLVEMPGLPTDEVRFVEAPGQNIFDFPRLFIDGSSWIWNIGVSLLAESGSDDTQGDYGAHRETPT